jgi:hypothetical protein
MPAEYEDEGALVPYTPHMPRFRADAVKSSLVGPAAVAPRLGLGAPVPVLAAVDGLWEVPAAACSPAVRPAAEVGPSLGCPAAEAATVDGALPPDPASLTITNPPTSSTTVAPAASASQPARPRGAAAGGSGGTEVGGAEIGGIGGAEVGAGAKVGVGAEVGVGAKAGVGAASSGGAEIGGAGIWYGAGDVGRALTGWVAATGCGP